MADIWQLFDEQGRPLPGKGANKHDINDKGLLHGAAHVWMWRRGRGQPEVLLQLRKTKRLWPDYYDISAAGHIDVGEDPLTTALRETQEELGYACNITDLHCIGVNRCNVTAPDAAWVENEFRWLYLLELPEDATFTLADGEVASVQWLPLGKLKNQLRHPDTATKYVPHGPTYYNTVFEAIERALQQ